MRFRSLLIPALLAAVAAGCEATASTTPETHVDSPSLSMEAAESSCTLGLHAILREAGSQVVAGQIQFRIRPPEPGSSDATVEYRGVFGPVDDLDFDRLSVALVPRVPDQGPTWSHAQKSDPGQTLSSMLHYGGAVPMSQAMALALVDDASRFKAVVNVAGVSGGKEAEGVAAPRTQAPESVRELQRVCFGGG